MLTNKSDFFALLNEDRYLLDHVRNSWDWCPSKASSSGEMSAEQPGSTRDKTLKAPMNDLICLTVVNAEQEARIACNSVGAICACAMGQNPA